VGGNWVMLGALCLLVGRLAQLSRHRARRHQMQLVSLRWDEIAELRRHEGPVDRVLLRWHRCFGELSVPASVVGAAVLAIGLFGLLSSAAISR
jgi:hypothetical protein